MTTFFGRPAKGSFRVVAQVQDAVIIDPLPTMLCADLNAAELKVATMCAAPKRDRFPNTGEGGGLNGRYGMHRRHTDHALAIKRCMRALRPIKDTFDCLYVTGLSGLSPAAYVAYVLKKDLLILRKASKEGDTWSHGSTLEGEAQYREGTRYMILDDFVANGDTMRRLFARLPVNGKLVGAMLYGHPRTDAERDGEPAKMLNIYSEDEDNWIATARYHMIRRGPNSMLFDFIKQED